MNILEDLEKVIRILRIVLYIVYVEKIVFILQNVIYYGIEEYLYNRMYV